MDHTHTFLTTQGHGGSPRMSDQPNAGATSETAHTWKTMHTKHTLSHPKKANMEWWLRRPNDIRGPWGGLKYPDIYLTDEEKPEKNLTQETCPDRGSNPGPLRDKRACYHLLHSGGRSPYIIKLNWFLTLIILTSVTTEAIGNYNETYMKNLNLLINQSYRVNIYSIVNRCCLLVTALLCSKIGL